MPYSQAYTGPKVPSASEIAASSSPTESNCRSSAGSKPCHTNAHNKCVVCPYAITWNWFHFEDIPTRHLYAALRLRQNVFIVEQGVPYADIDGKDAQSLHLLGLHDDEVIAYLRALPPGLFEPGYASFGRVVVATKMRGRGLGRQLIKTYLDHFKNEDNEIPIKISSQAYLEDFYSSFGFISAGEPYIEDLIPHIAMIKDIFADE